MEEMMISMSTQSQSNQSSPPWKHYTNPLYTHDQEPIYNHSPCHHYNCTLSHCSKNFSFSIIMEAMKAELEEARAQINELKDELEFEHRLRKKMESLKMRMAKELDEQKMAREATERVCEELGSRVSCHKAEIDRIRREIDEERRMMRVAEVLREERVQMKLEDARLFYEEMFLRSEDEEKPTKILEENVVEIGEGKSWILSENENSNGGGGGGFVSPVRRVSPEPENPHIKRGIKGSVEFQRVVRALCSNKSNRNLGGSYKLECQKAQLRILMKQRSSLQPSSNLVMS